MVFSPAINLANLNGENGFVINGVNASDFSAVSISRVGDLNNDDVDDLIIGATGVDPSGASYVVFGSSDDFSADLNLDSLDGNNGFVLTGVNVGEGTGASVSDAGDVNGDGIDDLIIGTSAFGTDPAGVYAGKSYVVFGSEDAFAASFDLSTIDGTNGFIITGAAPGDRAGSSVSSAGDVNGDGVDDLIIGALYADANGKEDAGKSYIVFGSDDGFDATVYLADLNGENGFSINGAIENDRSGWGVSSAGDINGDGFDDVIIGARSLSFTYGVYVVFGSGDGFSSNLELSSLDGDNGFKIPIFNWYDSYNPSVSGAGDVNGDGIDDLVVGVRGGIPDYDRYEAGQTYVIFGSTTGFDASFELRELDGSNGFVINGISENDFSGISVDGAGDINGDGLDDIIVGASQAEADGIVLAGQSYVVFGSSNAFPVSLELSGLNGINGFAINGIYTVDRSGARVSGAGDINGDGINDVIIGAYYADPNGIQQAGQTYVVFGRSESTPPAVQIIVGTLRDDYRIGSNESSFFRGLSGDDTYFAGSGDDTLEGNRGADLLFGGYGSDLLFGDQGRDYLSGGDGNDRLHGGRASDSLVSGSGNDLLLGNDGNDLLYGNPGNDTLLGHRGNDTIDCGGGSDVARGHLGNDQIIGGYGNDTLKGDRGNDSINGADGNDLLVGNRGHDSLSGGVGFDRLRGVDGDDILRGGSGKDRLFGGDGNDTLKGDRGNDSVDGGDGNDLLVGNQGDDLLIGGDGFDSLRGVDGDDTLRGGSGDDRLAGGNGADTFVITPNEGFDTIVDFEIGSDRIGLGDGLAYSDLSFHGSDILLGTVSIVSLYGVDTTALTMDDFTIA